MLNDSLTLFAKLSNKIKAIGIMNMKVEFLIPYTNSCNNVSELFFSDSLEYNSLENFEVAIIDKAVIVNPVVIDK